MDHYIEQALSRLRWGPLGQHVATFAAALAERGYARASVQIQLRFLSQLGRWMQRTRRVITDLDRINSEVFLATYRRRHRIKKGDRATLRHFIQHLQHQGVIAVPIAVPEIEQPFTKLERRYENHLLKERGLAAITVRGYKWFAHQFLLQCFGDRPLALEKLQAWEVSNFIVQYTSCKSSKRSQSMVQALRSFFRFLTQEGETRIDLATCIPSVPCRTKARLPKYIGDSEVEKLLATCDRSRAVGRRDYAILVLLARLGLRAGEVVGLRLEDIDWRSGEIHVLGKGVRDRLPLLPELGEALVAYLRDRPHSSSRNVFLRINAPCRPFGSSAVSTLVRRVLSRAGLKSPHTGASLLRHSLATNLLRKGASMAEIAELLRHRSSGTTEIYAKVDSLSLRALAQPWPKTRGGL